MTGTAQSLTSNASVTLAFNLAISDPHSWLNTSSYKITPTVAGWYLVTITLATSAAINMYLAIWKNGVSVFANYIGSAQNIACAFLVQCNGSTDYIQGSLFNASATTTVALNNPCAIQVCGPLA